MFLSRWPDCRPLMNDRDMFMARIKTRGLITTKLLPPVSSKLVQLYYSYIYRKMRSRVRRPKTSIFHPLPRKAFRLGLGPLFALIASKTDHLGPKTANLGPDPLPRPPTWAPGAAQDRPHRPQERPKTANIIPKSGPRPPT